MTGKREPAGAERLYAFVDRLLEESQVPEEAPEPVEEWVLFEVAGRPYGLPVAGVVEVVRVGTVTPVPGAPPAVAGVFGLRGRVLPLVDLGVVLAGEAVEVEEATRILVLESRGRRIGGLVSRALRLAKIAPSSVDRTDTGGAALGAAPAEGGRCTLLDIDRLLLIDDREAD